VQEFEVNITGDEQPCLNDLVVAWITRRTGTSGGATEESRKKKEQRDKPCLRQAGRCYIERGSRRPRHKAATYFV